VPVYLGKFPPLQAFIDGFEFDEYLDALETGAIEKPSAKNIIYNIDKVFV